MRAILCLLLLLSSCGFLIEDFADPNAPKVQYVSTCGAKFYGDDAEGFQEAEDRAVERFRPLFGDGVCASFKDWKVTTRDAPWIDQWGRKVGGLSGCDVSPGQNGWAVVLTDWHELSYFHEVAHRQECPAENDCKKTWGDTSPIWQAVREAAK